jgi:hypothetical protein
MRRHFAAGLALVLAASGAMADDCGFSFLRLPLSARATALGEAVAAMADDAPTSAYNPAGAALIRLRAASAGYLSYVDGIQAGQLSFHQPGLAKGTAGICLSYLNSGSIAQTTLDMPAGDGSEFTFTTASLSLAYGRELTPQVYVGAAAKGVHERVLEYTATAAALDLGAIYEVDLEAVSSRFFKSAKPRSLGTSLALGISAQNLGAAADAFIDVKEKLPLTFRLGMAYRPFMNRLALALGGVKTVDSPARFQAGLEYWLRGMAALRLGYNGVMADVRNGSSIDDLSGFACGLGVRYRGYSVGAAYTPFAGLGHPLRFELGADF